MNLEKRIELLEKKLAGSPEHINKVSSSHVVDWSELEDKLKEFEVSDACYFGISEMSKRPGSTINLKPEDSSIIIELLRVLGGYGVKDALQLLDSAKSILLECTLVHEKYKF